MKTEIKILSCAISIALGSTVSNVDADTLKPNKKPFLLSTSPMASGAAAAGKSSGKFLNVWVESDTPGGGTKLLYGRYTENGFVSGDAFLLAEASDSDNLFFPAVAMDLEGDAVVCWETGNYNSPPSSQLACRFVPQASSGTINTPVIAVTPVEQDTLLELTVAMDDSGDFLVAWTTYYDRAVRVKRFTSDGVAKENELVVADNGYGVGLAVDQDGDAVATWENGGAIFARRIAKDGGLPTLEFKVDRTPPEDSDDSDKKLQSFSVAQPSVALDDSGNFTVAWQRTQYDVKIKRTCHTTTYYGEQYTYCEDFPKYTTSTGIFAQRFDASNNALNHNKSDNSITEDIKIRFNKKQTHHSPDVELDADGNFVVLWQQDLYGKRCYPSEYGNYCYIVPVGNNLLVRKYNNVKNKLEASKSVVKKSVSSPFNFLPSLALDDDGSFQVDWTSLKYTYELGAVVQVSARYFPAKK